MTRVVLKYPVPNGGIIHTHPNPRIIHTGNQHEVPTVWIEQDTDGAEGDATVDVELVATGQTIPEGRAFAGTVILCDGLLVFHLYAHIEETQ